MLHAGANLIDISVKTDIVVSSMNCHAADNFYRARFDVLVLCLYI